MLNWKIKYIENVKSNASRESKDLEKLSKEIQEYFKNMLIKNTNKYIEESIKNIVLSLEICLI